MATAGYAARVAAGGLAGHRGYAMNARDRMVADLVQGLMCYGRIDTGGLAERHPGLKNTARAIAASLAADFPDAVETDASGLRIRDEARSLTRVIASAATRDGLETGSLAI